MKDKEAMVWEREAEQELSRVPFIVRPLVRRKVEERVRARGERKVRFADFKEAEAKFHSVSAGKSSHELEQMMPRPNEVGAPLVMIETCHNELSHCPNVLIKTADWRSAVEDWAKAKNVSERLRSRVKGDKVFFHHKLKIAIAGCPNGCSRPQIADFGLAGLARPEAEPALCAQCGACAEVCPDAAITVDDAPPVFDRVACQGCKKCRDICPDQAISLSAPGVRLLVGGKLGRHPRLAEVAGEVRTPAELVPQLDRMVNDYLEQAKPEERFADFWARTRKERQP